MREGTEPGATEPGATEPGATEPGATPAGLPSGASGGAPPLLAVPLRDGQAISIAPDGIRRGAERFELARVQDALQVSPDPETLALRVAGRGMVEFQPAQAGAGALILEALFRLRPDLRPAGFEAPRDAPAWWPPARPSSSPPPSAQSAWASSPAGVAPAGAYPAAHPAAHPSAPPPLPPAGRAYGPGAGAPSVASVDGRLTPQPRGALGLVGATFRLFVAHWRQWLVLGLCAAFVPALLRGVLDVVLYGALGFNPWRPVDASFGTLAWAQSLPAGRLGLLAGVSFAQFLLTGLQFAAAVACLAAATRDAVLGRPVSARANLRAGLRRLGPICGSATVVFGAFAVGLFAPIALFALSAPALRDVRPDAPLTAAQAAAEGAALLGLLLLVIGLPAAIYLLVRFGLAPFLAATEPLGARDALARSWALTRGAWWHTVGPVAAVALLAVILLSPLGILQSLSFAADALLAEPLVWSVATALIALGCTVVLYDLRLRREGYDALVHNV